MAPVMHPAGYFNWFRCRIVDTKRLMLHNFANRAENISNRLRSIWSWPIELLLKNFYLILEIERTPHYYKIVRDEYYVDNFPILITFLHSFVYMVAQFMK